MGVVDFETKEQSTEPVSGLLFSTLYLWLELKNQNFPDTAEKIRQSIDVFFQELGEQGKSTKDYIQLKGLLDKILLLNETQMSDYISYVTHNEHRDN